MKESSVIQHFLEEGERAGKIKAARIFLLSLGTTKLGTPNQLEQDSIECLADFDLMHELISRLSEFHSWNELLVTAEHSRSKKRREEGFERGRLEGARGVLVHVGERHFGIPEQRHLALIETITDLRVIIDLTGKIHKLGSWDELLMTHE